MPTNKHPYAPQAQSSARSKPLKANTNRIAQPPAYVKYSSFAMDAEKFKGTGQSKSLRSLGVLS